MEVEDMKDAINNVKASKTLESGSEGKTPHSWDNEGSDKCSKCGDKDWLADESCSEALLKNNVESIKTVDRPHAVALITAIEEAIDSIAINNMTPIEVYGCLHKVAAKYL